MGELFSKIDTDGDGQIEASEAARYIGDASVGAEDLECMQANVDGADQGDTISEKELQRHLQSLMKASLTLALPYQPKMPIKITVNLSFCHGLL